MVPHRTRGWVWVGRGFAVVVVAGVATYLYVAGVDKADKIASGLSLLVALTALGAPYLLPPPRPLIEDGAVSQVAADVVVDGRVAQFRRIRGGFRSSARSAGSQPPPAARSSSESTQADVVPGGQVVRGARVGGDIVQAGVVEGDVTLG